MNLFPYIFLTFLFVLFIGIAGFHHLFERNMVDSFYYASLVITGLSLEFKPETDAQKLFLGVYVLLSIGLYLFLVAGVVALVIGENW